MGLADGTYPGKATCWGLSETKNGDPQMQVEFQLADADGNPHTLNWFGSFANEKAEQITIKALRTMGWTGDDLVHIDALPNDVQLVVVNEEYPEGSGVWSTKIRWVNAAGGITRPLDEGKAASFAERMKARIAAFDAKNPALKVQRAEAPKGAPRAAAPARPAAAQPARRAPAPSNGSDVPTGEPPPGAGDNSFDF